MKRLATVVTLVLLLVGSVLLGSSDTDISIADTSVYDIETYIRLPEASNSSASATITITMTGILNE